MVRQEIDGKMPSNYSWAGKNPTVKNLLVAEKKPGVQLNQLVMTREQLQEIRALQEQTPTEEKR